MNPPGRSRDRRVRHPVHGSARWWSTPPRFDYIEPPVERAQLQQVGLGVFDRRHAQFTCLPHGVGEAAFAQVDGQYSRRGELPGCPDRLLAGAAACHQDFHPAVCR